MSFPSSLPTYQGFTSTDTLQHDNHAAQHNQEQADILALATKVGTSASTPTNGTFLAGNGTGSGWRPITTTDIGFSPLSVLQQVYPVGSIYTETTGVNPNTTFGFGTWVQYAQGQVLVGQKTGDANFGTAGATGGETTHLLTGGESGTSAHNHAITDPGHGHSAPTRSVYPTTGSAQLPDPNGTGTAFNVNTNTTGITINNSTTANASSAHNNLQPFIVVYIWSRTV